MDPGQMMSVGGVGEAISTGTLVALHPTLSQKSHNPVSPCMTSGHSSSFPLLELRVIGYKEDFVHWLFKRASEFPAVSCLTLVDGIHADFHSLLVCWLLSLAMVCLADEPVWG